MCLLSRYYEAGCGWVWLGDRGRWQPVRLPGHPANPPEWVPQLASSAKRVRKVRPEGVMK